ncbi:MAG: TraR/DksA family transcriptional regulator [Burkholderiaceae bacterium]|nr:TraR/DksA family transcriptional regulator [Burkholderiaceae bacterium]
MNSHLSDEQRTTLLHALQMRQHALERQMSSHLQDQSRVEFARELLQQDGDDAPQRASDREVDQTLSDLDRQTLAAVSEAQQRLNTDEFGLCIDCDEPIPFERLLIEPEARRCMACQSTHEAHHEPTHERSV